MDEKNKLTLTGLGFIALFVFRKQQRVCSTSERVCGKVNGFAESLNTPTSVAFGSTSHSPQPLRLEFGSYNPEQNHFNGFRRVATDEFSPAF